MNLHALVLVAAILSNSLLSASAAAITVNYGKLAGGGGYQVSTAPTSIEIRTTHVSPIVTGSTTVIYTFDTALFVDSRSPTCSNAGTVPFPTFTCATSSGGTVLTATLQANTLAAGGTITLTITNNVAGDITALPSSAQDVKVSSVTTNAGADSTTAATTIFRVIAAPVITLNSANYIAGTQPSGLEVDLYVPFGDGIASSDTITVEATKAIFTASVSTPTLTVSNPGANPFSGYTTTSNTLFTATFNAPLSMNNRLKFLIPQAAMALLPNSAGAVTYEVKAGASAANLIATGITGFTITSTAQAASAAADPVARKGHIVRAFELPLYELTPLVKAPDLTIYGSVFPGNPTEQWFDRMVFSAPDESRWLEVKVKKDLEHINVSKVPQWALSTLDVTIGYGSISDPLATTKMHVIDQHIPDSFLDHEIVFRKMKRHHHATFPVIGGFRRECLTMAGSALHLYVCTAPADEYYGHLHHLSLRYMHLDLAFVEVINFDELTGLLPELWGVRPMTENTRKYLKEETKEMPSAGLKEDDATAWVGDIGMENITKSCLETNESLERSESLLTV